jgi:hypothetical protein
MTPSAETLTFLDTDYSLKREKWCIRRAEEAGLEILRGDDHTLVFDLDSEEAYKTFMGRVEFLRAKFAMQHLVVSKSKSGNYHAVATLDKAFRPISQELALTIQACMGSDWKKEMLGVLRKLNYNSGDSILFRPQPLEIVYEWRSENES